MHSDWPVSRELRERARALVRSANVVTLATDRDVDGLAGGAILSRALTRCRQAQHWVVAGRGEHPHEDQLRARIRATEGDALVVVDMGSRRGPIVHGMPTVVIDHHIPDGEPDVDVFLSSHARTPIAPASVIAFDLAKTLTDVDDLAWIAALGAHGDLGAHAKDLGFQGGKDVADAVALLNAARRASAPFAEVAAAALLEAESAADIARGRVRASEALSRARAEVNAETQRCARTKPRFAGEFALLRFSSAAQVHPLVAIRWARRLHDKVVIAANDGYMRGRVNFAVRSELPLDLVELLQTRRPPDACSEYAHGHARATGGSLPVPVFERWLAALGFC
jgi:single-stranded DNA-specific DHH superfamily exonuclease